MGTRGVANLTTLNNVPSGVRSSDALDASWIHWGSSFHERGRKGWFLYRCARRLTGTFCLKLLVRCEKIGSVVAYFDTETAVQMFCFETVNRYRDCVAGICDDFVIISI